MVDRVLGRGRGRRGRRAAERVVDRRRAGVRAARLRAPRSCSSTPNASSASPRCCPPLDIHTIVARADAGAAPPARRALGRRARRRSRRRRAARRSTSSPKTSRRSSTRRARPAGPKGALGTHRNICGNLISLGVRRRAARRCAPASEPAPTAGPERVPPLGAVLPRDRLPLDARGEPRRGRQARADAQVGRRARARADRTRAGDDVRRRARDGVAGAPVAVVRVARHLERAVDRLRRRARRARAGPPHRRSCSRGARRRTATASPRRRRSRR